MFMFHTFKEKIVYLSDEIKSFRSICKLSNLCKNSLSQIFNKLIIKDFRKYLDCRYGKILFVLNVSFDFLVIFLNSFLKAKDFIIYGQMYKE
ncbi:MAG: hypothetical protein ACK4F9_00330 [Brevinematia bacterium]